MGQARPPLWTKVLLLPLAASVLVGPSRAVASPLAAPSAARPVGALPDEGDDQYQFLAGLCEKRLWDLAVKEGRAFLERHPRHAKADLARYRLATALFELGRQQEAEAEYERLARVADFEFAAEAAFRQGQCALARDDAAAAARAFERVLAAPKDYLLVPATFFLAEALFAQERFAEASARYAQALEAEPRGEYARESEYGLVWCAFRADEGDAVLQRAQAFERDHAREEGAAEMVSEVAFLRGEVLLARGDARGALAAYRAAGGGAHADAALRGGAFALSELGEHAAAAGTFEQVLERFPDSRHVGEAALHAGIEHLRAGDARAARSALADERVERTPEALFWTAQAQRQDDDAEAALATLDAALALRPGGELFERLQVARGETLLELGRGEDAQGAFQRAGNEYGLYAAAVSALNAGRHEQAAQLAGNLIGAHPDTSYRNDALLVIGEALLAQGQHEAARRAFERLLSAEPAPPPAMRARASSRAAWCLHLGGELAAAAASFAAVARDFPDAPEAEEALFMAGRDAEAAGDGEQAATAWRRWLERYPRGGKRPEVLLGLARLEPGREGARWLTRVLDETPSGPAAEEALFGLAERFAGEGQRREAVQAYARLLELNEASALARPARYGLAWSLYELEQYEPAERALAPLLDDLGAPGDLRSAALELSVWTASKRGDVQGCARAWRDFQAACDDEPRTLAALRVALGACRKGGELTLARELVDAFLERVRDRGLATDALVEAVWLALDGGEPEAAQTLLRTALRIAPPGEQDGEPDAAREAALAEAAFFVGEDRYAAGDARAAAELYDLAAPRAKGELLARVRYKRGFAALEQGDLAGAEQAFARLVAEHEGGELWPEGLYLLGETRFRRDDLAGAVAPLARLVREVPAHESVPKALFRLGLAQGRLGAWRECEVALTDLLRRDGGFPQAVEAQLWRGRALAARREARGARSAFEVVVASDRGALGAQARLELGHLARAAGDLDAALSEYLKVGVLYAHPPSVAEALLLSGECLEEQGDPEAARARYREVLEQHPDQPAAARARERLRALQGD